MRIVPCFTRARTFTILEVSEQELKNIRNGLLNHSYHPDSAWTRGVVSYIDQAIESCGDYHMKSWPPRPDDMP